MSDPDFIELLQKGDREAFRQLVTQHQQLVVKTAFAYVKNLEEAEDIAQEVFVSVYENIHKFRGESNIKTWIVRIAINKSINEIRRSKWKRMLGSFEQLTGKNELEIPDSKNPARILIEKQSEDAINKAMSKLSETQRTAFILHKYDDLSHQEIAEIMNLSISAVESLIFRAKQNLQKLLFISVKK